jgi:hypothetical protein
VKSIKKILREVLIKRERYFISIDRDKYFSKLIDPDTIQTWEAVAEYNAQIEILNNLYQNNKFTDDYCNDLTSEETLLASGTKMYYDEIIEEKLEELPYDEDVSSYKLDEYLDISNIPINLEVEDMVKMSHHPTNSIRSAGYIMRDGTLLDFERPNIDHRQLGINIKQDFDNTTRMLGFMDTTGAIRIGGVSGTAEIRTKPNYDQMQQLKRLFLANEPEYVVDYLDKNNDTYLRANSVYLIMDKLNKLYDPIADGSE